MTVRCKKVIERWSIDRLPGALHTDRQTDTSVISGRHVADRQLDLVMDSVHTNYIDMDIYTVYSTVRDGSMCEQKEGLFEQMKSMSRCMDTGQYV